MIRFRDRNTRGLTRNGWLDSQHSFSFGDYRDPRHPGFCNLRVINEDVVVPGAGFPVHGHAQMDILTWVLSGTLEHRDSGGASARIGPGTLQRMRAGPGVAHTETNSSPDTPAHFLQIWLIPDAEQPASGYEDAVLTDEDLRGCLTLGAARQGAPVGLDSETRLYITRLDDGQSIEHSLASGAAAWVQVARGLIAVNGYELREGDGASVQDEPGLTLQALTDCEVLLFEFPTANQAL